MDDERLIECVRRYPVIYDMCHHKYLDNRYKNIVWRTIDMEMNQDEDACRKRWCNIRDQFRKSLNKRKKDRAKGVTKFMRYKYESNLNFLIPHINPPGRKKRLGERSAEPTEQEGNKRAEQEGNRLQGQHSQSSDSEESSITDRSRKRPHENKTEPLTDINFMVEFLKNQQRNQNDHIEAFFKGLAATVKNFSPYYQYLAKGKLFAVVQELEWKQMLDECSGSMPAANSMGEHEPTATNPASSPRTEKAELMRESSSQLMTPSQVLSVPATSPNIAENLPADATENPVYPIIEIKMEYSDSSEINEDTKSNGSTIDENEHGSQ
ncbi:uncharacterized protein LOC114353515 [Ostrinia furnacalis]|uniref:uncharacterized protein LOC114353515 n=1 Tax=Ostrinia furnacalis TaxID=93504 RepID=UPI00103F06AC|nr:uncharacterized protein LOC114353515 [Ostrinia furnacalis]